MEGNDDASTPTESFLRCRGSGVRGKGVCRDWENGAREWAEGKALQWEGCDQRALCAKRILRVDITNGKIVLAILFVQRITVALKSTPSASPNTKENLQMEKSEVRLQYEKKKEGKKEKKGRKEQTNE